MKNFKTFLIVLILSIFISPYIIAQSVPQGMKYQAVARDLTGKVLPDENISIKITLLSNSTIGEEYYTEVHKMITNQMGLFSLVIGQGDILSGEFDKTPWSSQDIWMEIGIKTQGDLDFTSISKSKLLAVPYAFHASTASELIPSKSTLVKNGVPSNVWSLKGNLSTDPNVDKLGTTDSTDIVIVTDNIERLRITADGRIITGPGKFTMGGNLEVQGDSTRINKDLFVGRDVVLNFDDGFNPRGETINYGNFTVETMSSTLLTGTLDVDLATDLNAALNVDGETDFNSAFRVNNASTSNLTGSLNVTGATTLNNTLAANGQVTINAALGGDQNDFSSYPLRVQGGDHGIAIKVNGTTPQRNTNWLTLYDGAGNTMGRIEGFQGLTGIANGVINSIMDVLEDLADTVDDGDESIPPANMPPNAEQYFNNDYAVGALTETLDLANGMVKLATNSIACIAGLGLAGDCDDVFWSAVDAVVQAVQLGGYIAYNEINIGAAFESGGADYAEWLKKSNANENINFGEVVGVQGGLISKSFIKADQFMVVSSNPTIIGAMPERGSESGFEKIAFMGQVAVKVIGNVSLGDYILPSGNGDGMAIAIRPEAMTAKDFARIIGVAWSKSKGNSLFEYINTAVGLNTNDMAFMVNNMQLVMNTMQKALVDMNPEYQPHFFNAEGELANNPAGYTSSPSLNQVVATQIGIDQNSSREEAFIAVKDYAKSVNVDLSKYPYLNEILKNPNDKALLEKAKEHYLGVSAKLNNLLDKVSKR